MKNLISNFPAHSSLNLFQKFKRQKLIAQIPAGKLIVAVSGGPDSIAMLHLVWKLAAERKWKPTVAHIQHRLRGRESARDQKWVESFSRMLGLPCKVQDIQVREKRGSFKNCDQTGIEELSRKMRYQALAELSRRIGANAILTAHNANDQAETFFMHLLRGTGTDGLCGILPVRSMDQVTGNKGHRPIRLIRPFLAFSREEILEYLKNERISFCMDSSNNVLRFRRNWVRHKLIPFFEKVQPKMVQRVLDLISIFQNEQLFWERHLRNVINNVLKPSLNSGQYLLDLIPFFHYNISLRYRMLHRLFPECSFREINRIHGFLDKAYQSGKVSYSLSRSDFNAGLSRGNPGSGEFSFVAPGTGFSEEWKLRVKSRILKRMPRKRFLQKKQQPLASGNENRASAEAYFDLDKIAGGRDNVVWKMRPWNEGDKFQPLGMTGHKKIQDFFVDAKVPREDRKSVPILEAGNKIRWVVGYRIDEKSKVDSKTQRVLKVELAR